MNTPIAEDPSAGPGIVPARARRALLVLLLLAAALRLLYVTAPLLDAHRWRQIDTAAIARNLYEREFDLRYPQVDWGGPNGYVEAEFPLVPGLIALLYGVFGAREVVGRLVVIAFSLGAVLVMFALARRLLGTGAGLAAAFVLAVSPAAVYFGRTVMPDTPMLFLSMAGLLAFLAYLDTGRRRLLWLAGGCTTLACLVKLPALIMFLPILAAVWRARRLDAIRDVPLLAALGVPVLVTAAWYAHAYTIYLDTGLTFGILWHPARTYPVSVAGAPWSTTFSKWATADLLTGVEFYETLLRRLYGLLLLPWGLAGALLGAVLWRGGRRRVADAWLAGFTAFVLVAANGHLVHDYYQLPLVAIGALYFGAAAGPLVERALAGGARLLLCLAMAVPIGATGFYLSGVVYTHFRPDALDVRVRDAGFAIDGTVPADAVGIVTDGYGDTSPLLLYYAHRQGWSFGLESLSPATIESLRQRGARFFATTEWSRIERERRDLTAYLSTYRRAAAWPGWDAALFDLTRRMDVNEANPAPTRGGAAPPPGGASAAAPAPAAP